MGYYSTCELSLEFDMKTNAERFIHKIKQPEVPRNPLARNLEISTFWTKNADDKKEDVFYVELSDCFVQMGEYLEWIPLVAKAEGLLSGFMEIYGEEPGDIWKIDFHGDGAFTVYTGEVRFVQSELEYM